MHGATLKIVLLYMISPNANYL